MLRYFLFFSFLTACIACNRPVQQKLFSSELNTGIDFINSINETKEFNVFKYRNFYNGGGVATGDINNDGLADVFFTSNQGANKLYLNKGNFQFEDISVNAGFDAGKKQWSTGVVFVDINNDGWLDIYVCNAGHMMDTSLRKNQLFINNHDLTFSEQAEKYGLDNSGYSTQASFFDYDLDGDLDCFIVNNSPIPVNTLNYANLRDKPESEWPVKDFLKGGGDHLYQNNNGHFDEVTKKAGIHGGLISLGLGVNIADVNQDGYPDIYVSNDFFERDYLYINQRNGTFKDELEERVRHTSLSSMGADIQDINNDGYPDIFTTDMLPSDDYRLKSNTSFDNYDVFKLKQSLGFYNQFTQNALLVNNKQGKFWETAFYSGVAASDWSWGALMFDADNDGLSDILVCNGIARDVTDQDFIDFFGSDIIRNMIVSGKKEDLTNVLQKMPANPVPNHMFKNMGNLRFKNVIKDWGFDAPTFSNGAAYADLDNDGDLDIIINNVNEKALVYKNNAEKLDSNNFISLNLNFKDANKFAIGSVIKIYCDSSIINREVIPSRGFQSSVEYKQTIGLGKLRVDSVLIIWPDKTFSKLNNIPINTLSTISYDSVSKQKYNPPVSDVVPAFYLTANQFDKHTEDVYVDFYYERIIPFMLSKQGPKSAVADVNGDGLDDIFIGGGKDQESQLYIQSASGFVKKSIPDFKTYSFNDVTAVNFFDCDNDGDLDLFAGGGGNFSHEGFQNQLFINDGKGSFQLKRGALPVSNTNCGSVTVLDFNNDGFNDLFVGSRSTPQNYGLSPKSFLLQNDGTGNFKDVTALYAPDFQNLGMITSSAFVDVNGDGHKELIVAGEWMAPRVFSFKENKFAPRQITGLSDIKGWWQTMLVEDIDNDGHVDIVLGNLGENFYLQPTVKDPVKIWMKDFDNNGSVDKIITRSINGRDMPVFTKREITDQLPVLKKQNLKHHDYAPKSIQDLFGEMLNGAEVKEVNMASSLILYNDGKGGFIPVPLPQRAQLSSVNAIACYDLNGDGLRDLILGGNNTSMLPQFCTLDANSGVILMNQKDRRLNALDDAATGFNITGDTRDIALFNFKSQLAVLFLQNNMYPQLYTNSKK